MKTPWTRWQSAVVAVGLIALAVLAFFPPWRKFETDRDYRSKITRLADTGERTHGPIWEPPQDHGAVYTLDWARFAGECLSVFTLSAAAFFFVSMIGRNVNRDDLHKRK